MKFLIEILVNGGLFSNYLNQKIQVRLLPGSQSVLHVNDILLFWIAIAQCLNFSQHCIKLFIFTISSEILYVNNISYINFVLLHFLVLNPSLQKEKSFSLKVKRFMFSQFVSYSVKRNFCVEASKLVKVKKSNISCNVCHCALNQLQPSCDFCSGILTVLSFLD